MTSDQRTLGALTYCCPCWFGSLAASQSRSWTIAVGTVTVTVWLCAGLFQTIVTTSGVGVGVVAIISVLQSSSNGPRHPEQRAGHLQPSEHPVSTRHHREPRERGTQECDRPVFQIRRS